MPSKLSIKSKSKSTTPSGIIVSKGLLLLRITEQNTVALIVVMKYKIG